MRAAARLTDAALCGKMIGMVHLRKTLRLPALLLLLLSLITPLRAAEPSAPAAARLTVNLDGSGPAISPTLHGLFFEDINYGADGGLYAEMVQNRSFEHKDSLFAWSTASRGGGTGEVQVATVDTIHPANKQYARVQIRAAGQGFGLSNEGFGGIAVRKGENYRFSLLARRDPAYRGELVAVIEDEKGRPLGRHRVRDLSPDWKRFTGVLRSAETAAGARLVVLATGTGRVDLDVVSLFPENTWKKRPNGLRADLVQKLADMRPGFLRFPGGCIVEGKDLHNAYRWKDTIGDIAHRPQNWNRWMDWKAPQYYQTYGLGFFEYFQLCEDIGAAPVPVVNCGMSCQFQDAQLVPLSELGPWVQDALDLIEFANGPVSSPWGAKRAAMGHPKPFNMKYLGVGNEQWGEEYFKRYKVFYDAIKAKYPDIQLITTSGPGVDDNWWNLAWNKFKGGTPADIVDEHYYRPPTWFYRHSDRYDRYDRKGPKIFAGEYAAHGPGRRNTLGVALAEASFMTGLVRNADVVLMSSYAPLFAKMGSVQWQPDLIWFDNTRSYGSPSYHVQSLFGRHRGDVVLPTQLQVSPRPAASPAGRIGVGTWLTQAEFKDVRVTKTGRTLFASDFSKGTNGWTTTRGNWSAAGGVLRQTGEQDNVQAVAGDRGWTDYTLSLKARKLAGREGFLVFFQDNDGERGVWNLGGWGNKEHGLELPGLETARIPGSIETGRWYDIRIELKGPSVRAYLDNKLVQEGTRPTPRPLYAVATRTKDNKEIILKVVNPSAETLETAVLLQGKRQVASEGRATVLTADRPDVENTLDQPARVAPRESRLRGVSKDFRYRFPAHSLTVLRIRSGR